MNYPKSKRKKDPKLLKEIGKSSCVACGKPGPNDCDHILTKGAGHDDSINSCWSLCRSCHILKHQIGLNKFILYYTHLSDILISKGWYYENYFKKWRRNLD
jgi:hypothetical protein